MAETYRASTLGTASAHAAPVRQRKTPADVPNQSEPSGVRAMDLTAEPFIIAKAGSSRIVFPSEANTPSRVVPIKSRSLPSARRLRTSRAVAGVLGQVRLVYSGSM